MLRVLASHFMDKYNLRMLSNPEARTTDGSRSGHVGSDVAQLMNRLERTLKVQISVEYSRSTIRGPRRREPPEIWPGYPTNDRGPSRCPRVGLGQLDQRHWTSLYKLSTDNKQSRSTDSSFEDHGKRGGSQSIRYGLPRVLMNPERHHVGSGV